MPVVNLSSASLIIVLTLSSNCAFEESVKVTLGGDSEVCFADLTGFTVESADEAEVVTELVEDG